tara:strand:- start:622 stop:867 length:246 start_codon:yes stop_codon:yes gene_type:complete
MELDKCVKVNGWNFNLVGDDGAELYYQCRGAIMHDDEHDEVPEQDLMNAAFELQGMLECQGIKAEADHSEKGWVEVTVWGK